MAKYGEDNAPALTKRTTKKLKDMKKLLFIIAFLFASVTIYANPIEKLKKLADKIEREHKSYDEEDWKKVNYEYEKLEKEFEEKERSTEERKDFARQKGRINGYLTKKTLNNLGKKVGEYANELGGSIEGFFESVENMLDE